MSLASLDVIRKLIFVGFLWVKKRGASVCCACLWGVGLKRMGRDIDRDGRC